MAVGDSYRITTQASFNLNNYQNTWAVIRLTASNPTQTEFQNFANDVKELYRPSQTAQIVYTQWGARQLWGLNMEVDRPGCKRINGLVFSGVFSGSLTGGNGPAQALPPQSAMVSTLVSGIAGRRKRGRVYAFGWTEDDQSAGIWDSALLTTQNTRWTTFLAKYSATGTDPVWQLGVWSERIASGCVVDRATGDHVNVDVPSPETAFTPVIAQTLRPTVFTQRRRVRGVGF
jgi:hypothetical protein